ncbi:Putative Mn2+ efflux pump MntP [Pseudobutyrivibrio sp. 49]|uniref:manganese efflux pump n=1 Tax=Pseudobutyrivibrio sp. 49 TaxID=1855344 RepID=UPI00088C0EAD|nr:manganese efflux pump [Pseudobutyrivibrio sp. 49]SDH26636.1 Putative Mn2+ efflux pump MntP [Pseudobutyrivibrio sp. 49]
MSLLEDLLIIVGVLLDVFATMEIQGSMMVQIKKKTLAIACGVVAAVELAFFFAGYAVCWGLSESGYIADPVHFGEGVAVIVLAILGIRLIVKAIKQEFIQERRRDVLRVWDYIRIIVVSSFYTAAAGCVCGFVGITVWHVFVIILVISVLMVIMGLYIGLHFGFENKTIAYVIGVVLLWGVSLEMLLHDIVEVI